MLDLEKQRRAQNPKPPGRRTSIVAPVNTHKFNSQEQPPYSEEQEQPPLYPATPTDENQRKLTTLHRRAIEHYQPGLGYRQLGELIGVGKDKAGDIIKELKKWGFLKEDGADE